MNFNPLMLLPLIMGGKNGGDADMTKMLEMMNPDALLSALPVDDKTKTVLNMVNGLNAANQSVATEETEDFVVRREKPRPDARIFGADINRALSELMNGADGRR